MSQTQPPSSASFIESLGWDVVVEAPFGSALKSDSEATTAFLSAEALKSWSRCKKQFQLKYLEQRRWPSSTQNFRLGIQVHKLLDYQAKGLDLTSLLLHCDADVRQSFELITSHRLAQPEALITSEWAFHLRLGASRSVFTGRVDRLVRLSQTQWALVDWKTGTATPREPQSAWQTKLYLAAAYQLRTTLGASESTPPSAFSFIYLEAKLKPEPQLRELQIDLDEAYYQAICKELENTALAIEAERRFELPEQCPDKHCVFRHHCGILKAD
jgi:PD-(D/E)XK nuclease superfamily